MIFVAGALPENSGKTTLALALIQELKTRGLRVNAFKPLSGHSMWWQYASYKLCLKYGSLFCEDAYKLWDATDRSVPIEALNPADVLISIPSIDKVSASKLQLMFKDTTYDWFTVGRFTIAEDGLKHIIYYKSDESRPVIMASELLEKLKLRASRLIGVKSLEEYLNLHKKYYGESVDACYKVISRGVEEVVVESFNDSIYPWRGVEVSAIVTVAAPAHVMIYESNKFFEAVKILGNPYIRVYRDICLAVKPLKILRAPPLTNSELADRDKLRKKYEDVTGVILRNLERRAV